MFYSCILIIFMENRKNRLLRKTIKQIATIEWFRRKIKNIMQIKTISVGAIQINRGDMYS